MLDGEAIMRLTEPAEAGYMTLSWLRVWELNRKRDGNL